MTTASPIWLNGYLVPGAEPCLSAFDRGFTLGDGVFETIRGRDHQPLWLDDHLRRFHKGADMLGIPVTLTDDAIAEGLINLLAALDHNESALRLTLSRGPSERRGLWPPSISTTPTLLATAAELPTARSPLRLAIAQGTRRNEHSPLSRIKSLNYGDNLLARREAEADGMDDALMINSQGRIACASVANLFLHIDGRWRTPPVSEGALPGLARQRLLQILDAEEKAIAPFDAANADIGLLSNSLSVAGIQEIDGHPLQDATTVLETFSLFDSR